MPWVQEFMGGEGNGFRWYNTDTGEISYTDPNPQQEMRINQFTGAWEPVPTYLPGWRGEAQKLLGQHADYAIEQFNSVNPNIDWTPFIREEHAAQGGDGQWQSSSNGSRSGVVSEILGLAANSLGGSVGRQIASQIGRYDQLENQENAQILAAQNQPDDFMSRLIPGALIGLATAGATGFLNGGGLPGTSFFDSIRNLFGGGADLSGIPVDLGWDFPVNDLSGIPNDLGWDFPVDQVFNPDGTPFIPEGGMPPAIPETPEQLREWGLRETAPGVWEAPGIPDTSMSAMDWIRNLANPSLRQWLGSFFGGGNNADFLRRLTGERGGGGDEGGGILGTALNTTPFLLALNEANRQGRDIQGTIDDYRGLLPQFQNAVNESRSGLSGLNQQLSGALGTTQNAFQGLSNQAGALTGSVAGQYDPLINKADSINFQPQYEGLRGTVGNFLSTAPDDYNNLLREVTGNRSAYVQAQINPLIESQRTQYKSLLEDQANRRIGGSSFGQQSVNSFLNTTNQGIADATARALEGSYGLQNQLIGNRNNTMLSGFGLQGNLLGAQDASARSGINQQASLLGNKFGNTLSGLGLQSNLLSGQNSAMLGNLGMQAANIGAGNSAMFQGLAGQGGVFGNVLNAQRGQQTNRNLLLGQGLNAMGRLFGRGSGNNDWLNAMLGGSGLGGGGWLESTFGGEPNVPLGVNPVNWRLIRSMTGTPGPGNTTLTNILSRPEYENVGWGNLSAGGGY